MDISLNNVKGRLDAYCDAKKMHLIHAPRLGWGQDGEVYSTNLKTAVKGFKFSAQYRQELAVYERLKERLVVEVEGFAVPKLLDHSADFAVIEMEIVKPPFVVDFVAARLDRPPQFSEEEIESYEEAARERFGGDWDQVLSIRAVFRRHGIYLGDLNPKNIRFR
ncbi:hypothetical protein SH661x_004744 [Planctomicrobium sp. SH661]|uniref:hypothetical protein n=1 Tax=Planctomicrobium sp. SH661 TaxID=3448124 RepID=UPI003F5B0DA4